MKKVKADALDSLGLTALLPLYIRAVETYHDNPLLTPAPTASSFPLKT